MENQPPAPLNVLAVCSYSPGQQLAAREALDAILACAIFDQNMSLLFCGEGVGQLLKSLADYTGSDKPLSQSLGALPLYDVEALYVDAQSLQERGLTAEQLIDGVSVISAEAAGALLSKCDRIMSF